AELPLLVVEEAELVPVAEDALPCEELARLVIEERWPLGHDPDQRALERAPRGAGVARRLLDEIAGSLVRHAGLRRQDHQRERSPVGDLPALLGKPGPGEPV